MKNKNIVILYSSFGSGFKASALGFEEKIKELYPSANITLLDPFSFAKPFTVKVLGGFIMSFSKLLRSLSYKFKVEKIPTDYKKKYDYYYSLASIFWNFKLENKLNNLKPDFIFSTNAYTTNLIAFHKEKTSSKLISIISNYGFKTAHIIAHENIDFFTVPTSSISKRLVSHGVLSDKINVTGTILRKQFNSESSRDYVFEKYHLSKTKPLYLFVCGSGIGHESGFKYFEALLKSNLNFSYLFISSGKEHLEVKAKSLAVKYGKSGKVLGYVNNIAEVISVSSLVIGKAGGVLVNECLSCSTPFYSFEPIGPEVFNSIFIQKNGFGFYAKNMRDFNLFLKKVHNKTIVLSKIKNNINKNFDDNSIDEFLLGLK